MRGRTYSSLGTGVLDGEQHHPPSLGRSTSEAGGNRWISTREPAAADPTKRIRNYDKGISISRHAIYTGFSKTKNHPQTAGSGVEAV